MLCLLACLALRPPMVEARAASAALEIDHLIEAVETSPCRFQRNDRWYDGHQAAAHLRDKLAWLATLGQMESAEEFIAKVASTSSLSSHAYGLSCSASTETTTGPWLREELARFRARTTPGH